MANSKSTSSTLELNVPTYIPLPDAAQKLDLSEQVLTQLIQVGKIDAVQLPSGELLVPADNGYKTKEQILREKYADLAGHLITVTEAARKYEIPRSTMEKWIEKKHIQIIDPEAYPMKIDEAEAAYCAEVYKKRKASGITYGVPLLDDDGLPYELKRPKLSEYRRKKRVNDNDLS